MKHVTGEQAKANFDTADKLVREGKFLEAEAMYSSLYPSDVGIIAKRIRKAKEVKEVPDGFPSPY